MHEFLSQFQFYRRWRHPYWLKFSYRQGDDWEMVSRQMYMYYEYPDGEVVNNVTAKEHWAQVEQYLDE